MKLNLTYKRIIIISCIISILVGIFLHFAYNLSDKNNIVGLFAPVNESTFEHLKLLFIPYTLFGILFFIAYHNKLSNIPILTFLGNIVGMFVIVTLYYFSLNFPNISGAVTNIVIYIIGVITSYYIFYLGLYDKEFYNETKESNIIGVCALTLLFTLFVTKTYSPIKTLLTIDPQTKTYGIYEKSKIY